MPDSIQFPRCIPSPEPPLSGWSASGVAGSTHQPRLCLSEIQSMRHLSQRDAVACPEGRGAVGGRGLPSRSPFGLRSLGGPSSPGSVLVSVRSVADAVIRPRRSSLDGVHRPLPVDICIVPHSGPPVKDFFALSEYFRSRNNSFRACPHFTMSPARCQALIFRGWMLGQVAMELLRFTPTGVAVGRGSSC